MTPFQRRFFALSVFALSFVFFYEARGARLLRLGRVEEELANAAKSAHFWPNVTLGTFVLILGATLLLVLRRPGQKLVLPLSEVAVYALGVGILIGTAYVSWVRCGF